MVVVKKWLVIVGIIVLVWNEYLLPMIYSMTWEYNTVLCVAGRSCSKFLIISNPQLQGYQDEQPLLGYITRWDADRYINRYYKWAVDILKPDGIIVLGDVFDEGSKAIANEHKYTTNRLSKIFNTAIPTIILPGDNDIGGEGHKPFNHDAIEKFESQYGEVNDVKIIKGVEFVKLNTLGYNSLSKSGLKDDVTYNSMSKFMTEYASNRTKRAKKQRTLPPKRKPNAVILLSHVPLGALFPDQKNEILQKIEPIHVLTGHTLEFDQKNHTYQKNGDRTRIAESITPTISYRMGTEKIGFLTMVVAHHHDIMDDENSDYNKVIDGDDIHIVLNKLPSRYHSLFMYLSFLFVGVCSYVLPANCCKRGKDGDSYHRLRRSASRGW